MKIIFEEPPAGAEEQIIVQCRNITPQLMNILNTIKQPDNMLVAYIDNEIHRVSPSDVFYFEAVDKKTFVYCAREVYESKLKLYELNEMAMNDFFRVSKSVIVNLRKIKSIIPSFSGRVEAVLENKERVIISRQYVSELKKVLGL
ncbi:MAG: LytTR family transcriptional regulator DNA-binding domain-containing protein [Defluviitaleaceae bacterium]|nr:LytTR family transcriptional regulator DNA-binding domain-containing protein [Defluviitaleaceae bacterium]